MGRPCSLSRDDGDFCGKRLTAETAGPAVSAISLYLSTWRWCGPIPALPSSLTRERALKSLVFFSCSPICALPPCHMPASRAGRPDGAVDDGDVAAAAAAAAATRRSTRTTAGAPRSFVQRCCCRPAARACRPAARPGRRARGRGGDCVRAVPWPGSPGPGPGGRAAAELGLAWARAGARPAIRGQDGRRPVRGKKTGSGGRMGGELRARAGGVSHRGADGPSLFHGLRLHASPGMHSARRL
jgi:hypothetical protein